MNIFYFGGEKCYIEQLSTDGVQGNRMLLTVKKARF